MRRTATKNRLFGYLPKKTFTTRNQAKPGTVFRLRQLKNPVSSSGQGKPGESHHLPESTEPIDGLLAIKSVRRKQRRRKFRPIDRIGIPLTDDGDPFVIPVAAARLRFGASAAQAIAGVERHAGCEERISTRRPERASRNSPTSVRIFCRQPSTGKKWSYPRSIRIRRNRNRRPRPSGAVNGNRRAYRQHRAVSR